MTRPIFAAIGASIGYWLAVVIVLVSWDIVVDSATTDADRRLAETLGRQVAVLAEAAVLDGNRPALSHLLSRMTSVEVIDGMWLYGVDGEPLATAGTLGADDTLVFPVVSEANVAAYLRVAIADRSDATPGLRALTATIAIWPLGWVGVVAVVYALARPRRRKATGRSRQSIPDGPDGARGPAGPAAEWSSTEPVAPETPTAAPAGSGLHLIVHADDDRLTEYGLSIASTYGAVMSAAEESSIELTFAVGDDRVFQAICAGLLLRRTLASDYRVALHDGLPSDARLIAELAESATFLITNAALGQLRQPERALLEPVDHPAIGTLAEPLNPCLEVVDAAPSHQSLLDRQATRLRASLDDAG